MINLNGSNVDEMYYGSTKIGEAYYGNELVYHVPTLYEKCLYSGTNYVSAGTLNDDIRNFDRIVMFAGGAGKESFNSYGAIGYEYDSKVCQNSAIHQLIIRPMGANSPHLAASYFYFPTFSSFKIWWPTNKTNMARYSTWGTTAKFTNNANDLNNFRCIKSVWGVTYK